MIGYYADNGTEFRSVKMDELVSKLGISIHYGPAYSPWSNGVNEHNNASCEVLFEDKETMTEMGMKTLPGDKAFYYQNECGVLRGVILSHVDDFSVAGDNDFIKRKVNGISE